MTSRYMKRASFLRALLLIITFSLSTLAFSQAYQQQGEVGISLGASHYFGDLNNKASIDHPDIAVGVFFRKQFTNYTAIRISGHYTKVGYSDSYNTNEFQRRRNLSFNSDIYEFAILGDFNFFRFNPQEPGYQFTPYMTFGIGVFSYDPYTYYNGDKVYLRPLHTEGQTVYKGRKEYGKSAICFPVGFGIKYSISKDINMSIEITHRFTTTDYLDDVSTTYAGASYFTPNSTALALQDRSYETGTLIGVEGKQRGWSKQKDQYTIAEIGITFNIFNYNCPSSE
jgi:hypothetical protein